MKHSAFFWFVLPSAAAMLLFIFFPTVSIIVQSFHVEHEQVIIEVENCGPFGCQTATAIDQEATAALREAEPLGRFAGLEVYKDRNHLAVQEFGQLWDSSDGLGDFIGNLMNLPFYKALGFTLTYTAIVTPLTVIFGFIIAVAVNSAARILRGPLIFFTLLPNIVTPLIGGLILFWMVDARGVIGTALRWLANDPDLSVKADTGMMWTMLMVYGVWSSAPFAFIVYYAGLQTVSTDTLEAARIDGASRWQQIQHVVIPHLLPLTTFIALIQLMDNFRVFEAIISFNAQAHATSLSWAIFNDLGGETQQLSSAAATSVLTVIGVAILLSPVLVRTYRSYGKA